MAAKEKNVPVVAVNNVRKFHPTTVTAARMDATNLTRMLGSAALPAANPTASGVIPADAAPGDTETGIVVDYEGPVDGDIPVGALQDAQIVSLIKNILGRGDSAPFFYRFHSQIYLRVATIT